RRRRRRDAAAAAAGGDDEPAPRDRRHLLADIYEDFEAAKGHSALVALMTELRPGAVVDCINTATAISYQDVPTTAKGIMADLGLRGTSGAAPPERLRTDVESLLISIEVPQLVLHVRLLHHALREAGTEVYLKVGTTGTGGMGLNIPYTHGEEKPSPTLMAKTAVAFAQTGLLFLAARSPDGPVVKELKPAAMIGYRDISVSEVPGYVWTRKGERFRKKKSPARPLYEAQERSLTEPLDTTPDPSAYPVRLDAEDRPRTIRLACVNTGENGWFAGGEFEAITALDQMEVITPEEIARDAVHELYGRSTGRDVLGALDGAILGPTYKGGLVREVALDRLGRLENEGSVPSVALGDLGPPQLSKYLFELYLIRAAYETIGQAAAALGREDAGTVLAGVLRDLPDLRDGIVSVGIPVLLPDGGTILRGPEIKVPGYDPSLRPRPASPEQIDLYASRGWVDLRADSLRRWGERLRKLLAGRRTETAGASAAMSHETYGRDDFRIGEVVAWVFANEEEFRGFRIK
ncbi:MAG: hypothetical protein ACE5JG_04020, partial [Planctomycetota bacterium]